MSQALCKTLESPHWERELDRGGLLQTAGSPTPNCRAAYSKLQDNLLQTAGPGGCLLQTAGVFRMNGRAYSITRGGGKTNDEDTVCELEHVDDVRDVYEYTRYSSHTRYILAARCRESARVLGRCHRVTGGWLGSEDFYRVEGTRAFE